MKKEVKLYKRISLINKKFGKNSYYHYLKTPKISIIIPKLKDKFILVSQLRIPINQKTFEFPGGLIDKKGESPWKSVSRELIEETGYKSLKKPKKIFEVYADPGRLNSQYIFFFSNSLLKIKLPEEGIKIHFFSEKKILNLIKSKKINHACHIAAFLNFIKSK